MTTIRHSLLTLAMLPLLLVSASAQDELILKDHLRLIRGEIVASTPDSVTFRHTLGDKSDTQTYASSSIDPFSFYFIRSHAVGDDAAAKVELGHYCEDHHLYTRGRAQFEEALRIDKSLDLKSDIEACRDGIAAKALEDAQALTKYNDWERVFRDTSVIIREFGTTPTAAAARALNASAYKEIVDARASRDAGRQLAEGGEVLQAVRADVRRAAEHNMKGLQAEESSNAERDFKVSVEGYHVAITQIGEEMKTHQDNAKLVASLEKLLGQAKAAAMEVHMNLGSLYATRGSYPEAFQQADAALAIDGTNSSAKAFRAKLADEASQSGFVVYPLAGVGVRVPSGR